MESYVNYVEKIWQEKAPIQPALLGAGYNHAILSIISTLTDGRFFKKITDCSVEILGEHKVRISSPTASLRKEWVNLINGWTTVFLHYSISETANLLLANGARDNSSDFFHMPAEYLCCLQWLYTPSPYLKFSKLRLECGGMSRHESVKCGLPSPDNRWQQDSKPGFSYTLEFEECFFPEERFDLDRMLEHKKVFTFGDIGAIGNLDLVNFSIPKAPA